MTEEVREFPQYFYHCNKCDASDHGAAFYDYEVVDCPSCGTRDMTRWEAKPNLSREWAYCEAFGHEWRVPPREKDRESCAHCGSSREFSKKK